MPSAKVSSMTTREGGQTSTSDDDDVDDDDIDGLKAKLEEKMRRHRYVQVIVFMVVLALDSVDLISDWLFYADISIAEQGLVYGLPDRGAVIALLVFSIAGTVTFVVETANLGKEIFTGKPWFNVDLVTAVVVWTEDVPQISINVFIALCREDPISIFQLTKASVVIFGMVIRIVVTLARYCSKASMAELKQHTKTSHLHICYHFFSMFGLLLTFAGACSVFTFTQTQRDLQGNIIFQVPNTVFEERYHDDRYFKNVSIYFHHPTFDVNQPTNISDAHWMRLIKINSVRNLPGKVVMFNYQYQDESNQLKMVLWENENGSSWAAIECYTIDKTTTAIVLGTNCNTYLSTANRVSIIFKFSFIPPDRVFRKLIFGDIRFNVLSMDGNDVCTAFATSNITDTIGHGIESHAAITVHYYRTSEGEDRHVVMPQAGSPRFYQLPDLTDITTVWETGWLQCETKGSIAPHVDDSIQPPCVKL